MAITVRTGKVSHIQHAAETSGQIHHGKGQIQTSHSWAFRLDDRSALYKQRQSVSFAEGDVLTAVGEEKSGTFKIICCRNETSGAVNEAPATLFCVLGVLLILLICAFPIGIWALWLGLRMSKANKLLQLTPRATA
jgi:hypothetical protein